MYMTRAFGKMGHVDFHGVWKVGIWGKSLFIFGCGISCLCFPQEETFDKKPNKSKLNFKKKRNKF
jgi:hypothetical protein